MSSQDVRYQQICYPSIAHPLTHPAHVGAMARLYGLPAPSPARARILELGSACGTNLNWIARTLPNAECLGMDITADAVSLARETASQQNLNNVSFAAADLLNHDFGNQKFDYIIAHGLFSWVDEPVQQRAFEVCKDHLAENGVALISYNAMPGCSTRDALRKLFLLEIGESDKTDANVQLQHIDRVLSFFEAVRPTIQEMPHAGIFDLNIQTARKKNSNILLHDEISPVCEPYYLLQFCQWAAEAGLSYVADTELITDWMDGYPKELRHAIHNFRLPRMKALQYADYVFNTSFRSALLCQQTDAKTLGALPTPSAFLDLSVSLKPATELKSSEDEVVAAVTNSLAENSTSDQPFHATWQTVFDGLERSPTDADLSRITRYLMEAACSGKLQLTLGPSPAPLSVDVE